MTKYYLVTDSGRIACYPFSTKDVSFNKFFFSSFEEAKDYAVTYVSSFNPVYASALDNIAVGVQTDYTGYGGFITISETFLPF